MTVSNGSSGPSEEQERLSQISGSELELNLRRYAQAMLAWWREIIVIALLAALLTGVAVYTNNKLAKPLYTATADIVIARLVSAITLDERVSTQSTEVDTTAGASARRGALAQLAMSGAIAQAVTEDLGTQLPVLRRNPAQLMKMVETDVPSAQDGRTSSDIIRIHVTANDPELAAAIANSWAVHYVDLVNTVYGGLPNDVIESVNEELRQSTEELNEAHKRYEEFLAVSRVDSLTRQVKEAITQRDNLQNNRDLILFAIAEQDLTKRLSLFKELTDAQADSLLAVFSEQNQATLSLLSQLYSDRVRAARYLNLANNLQDQIEAAGEEGTATNQLALETLKRDFFTLPTAPSLHGNNSLSAQSFSYIERSNRIASIEAQMQDVEALITALDQTLTELDTNIETINAALLTGDYYEFLDDIDASNLTNSAGISGDQVFTDSNGLETVAVDAGQGTELQEHSALEAAIIRSYASLLEAGTFVEYSQSGLMATEPNSLDSIIESVESRLQGLRSELAAEEAREQLLLQQRDLAWNTYDAISNRAAELSISVASDSSEVRIGSLAIPPLRQENRTNIIIAVMSAFVFSLLAGIVLAWIAHYFGYNPPLNTNKPNTRKI